MAIQPSCKGCNKSMLSLVCTRFHGFVSNAMKIRNAIDKPTHVVNNLGTRYIASMLVLFHMVGLNDKSTECISYEMKAELLKVITSMTRIYFSKWTIYCTALTNLNRTYYVCSCLSQSQNTQSNELSVKTELMRVYERTCHDDWHKMKGNVYLRFIERYNQ